MTTIYDECSKDELLQIVSEMQNDLNQSRNEIKLLNKELNGLYKDLEKANTEINRLKMIIDLKDDARVELVKENTNLRKNIEHLCDENIRLRHELNEVKNNANNKIY